MLLKFSVVYSDSSRALVRPTLTKCDDLCTVSSQSYQNQWILMMSWKFYLDQTSLLCVAMSTSMPIYFVGRFSACYGSRPCGKFSDLHFGETMTFKLIAGF